LLSSGWGNFFLDLPKQGRFGRDSRDGLAACLRRSYPAPDPPTKLSALTYPLFLKAL